MFDVADLLLAGDPAGPREAVIRHWTGEIRANSLLPENVCTFVRKLGDGPEQWVMVAHPDLVVRLRDYVREGAACVE